MSHRSLCNLADEPQKLVTRPRGHSNQSRTSGDEVPDATLPAPLELALSLPSTAPPKSSQLTRLFKLCVTQRGAARAPTREGPGEEERALSWASSPAARARQAPVSLPLALYARCTPQAVYTTGLHNRTTPPARVQQAQTV